MLVIPVLDFKGGVVVHATGGDRSHYLPIETALSPGRCDPVSVALGYRALHAFPAMYVADLDAIAGGAPNREAVSATSSALPDIELWVDDGRPPSAAHAALSDRRLRYVIGSESLGAISSLEAMPPGSPHAAAKPGILSLDFRGNDFLGPPDLLVRPDLWPETMIVMTLGRVGSGAGPDFERLWGIIARAEGRQVIAAGGVRHVADLEALAAIGVAGALVATALHSGQIKAGDLERVAGL
ncbi:MAG: nickel transporter [Hyphomicrobium sp.]|nr:MAG: nickel transporter [Hyphomicrobium sp.]